jgi:hypothetical protein
MTHVQGYESTMLWSVIRTKRAAIGRQLSRSYSSRSATNASAYVSLHISSIRHVPERRFLQLLSQYSLYYCLTSNNDTHPSLSLTACNDSRSPHPLHSLTSSSPNARSAVSYHFFSKGCCIVRKANHVPMHVLLPRNFHNLQD